MQICRLSLSITPKPDIPFLLTIGKGIVNAHGMTYPTQLPNRLAQAVSCLLLEKARFRQQSFWEETVPIGHGFSTPIHHWRYHPGK